MTTRTARTSVTFAHPFRLSGFTAPQAPGTFQVDTDEELIEGVSFPAWRRIATTMTLPKNGATEFVAVDPVELDASLLRDAGHTILPAAED